jgi:hypothetical protein
VLAVLHCVHCNVGVACPVGTDVDKVYIRQFTKSFPTILACECGWSSVSTPCDYGNRFVDVLLDKVAQSSNPATVDMHHTVHSALCAHTKPHETNPDTFNWFAL